MSLADDLLGQAWMLANRAPRNPTQVNLRRAVSAAYYALFHLLTAEAAKVFATPVTPPGRISRGFSHAEMKKASAAVADGRWPKVATPPKNYEIPTELSDIAKVFVQLQKERVSADYDTIRFFERKQVLVLIESVTQAFVTWDRVKTTDDARLYLMCLFLWDRWDKEPQ